MDLLSCLPLFLLMLVPLPATRFHHMQSDPHPSFFKCLLSCLSLHTPTKRASGFPFAHQSNRPQLLRSPQSPLAPSIEYEVIGAAEQDAGTAVGRSSRTAVVLPHKMRADVTLSG
ncbi:hypothetical protein V8C43DRAFT_317344 [Trichoderma afarasin]